MIWLNSQRVIISSVKTLANEEKGVQYLGVVMPLRNLETIFLISSLLFNSFPAPCPYFPQREKTGGGGEILGSG